MDKFDKVMITVEQEKALELFKKHNKDQKIAMELFLRHRKTWDSYYKPLKDIPPNDFIKILCGWYEVRDPFEVGDWVYDIDVDLYGKIECVNENGSVQFRRGLYKGDDLYSLVKVTEQWKIMLLELDREKPEFVEGDMCITKAGCYMYNFEHFNGVFEDGIVEYFYPVESRIEIK